MELAKRGGVDILNPGFLREATNVRTWEVLDQFGRDVQHLYKLTPTFTAIYEAGVQAGVAKEVVNHLCPLAGMAASLVQESLGGVGYTWLSQRQVASQLIYALACEIQGDPHATDADERQARSEKFLMEFYGHEWSNSDPELHHEVEYCERQLGMLYCLRVVAVLTAHPELDLVELTRQGLMKYGVNDLRGRRVCYWCSGVPCVCGGRKGGMKAKRPEITRELVLTRGLPEMDQHMVVYGVGRNSAINALAGVARSLSEDGGEYAWVRLMSLSGGTNEGIRKRLGCLYLDGTRHTKMADKKTSEQISLLDSLYSEAADAVVSWPCLVHQAFGLNFVRSVKLGLEHMAKGAGVELVTPEDLAKTVPFVLYSGKWMPIAEARRQYDEDYRDYHPSMGLREPRP